MSVCPANIDGSITSSPVSPRTLLLSASLGILTASTLGSSLYSITVLYVTLPGLVFLAILSATVAWLRLYTLKVGGVNVFAVLLVILFGMAVASVLFTWSATFLTVGGLGSCRLGSVGDEWATFWCRDVESETFSVKVRGHDGEDWEVMASGVLLEEEADHTGWVRVGEGGVGVALAGSTKYDYLIEFDGAEEEEEDEGGVGVGVGGSFKTLPIYSEVAPGKVRFAYGSCAMKSRRVGFMLKGFMDVKRLGVDFLLFLGDLIYADVPLSGSGLGSDVGLYERRVLSAAC